MKTEEILNEREKTHGDFLAVSALWCELTYQLDEHYKNSQVVLDDAQKAAVRMILLKISRIVCGNPDHADHWDDIAGYAMLGKGQAKEAPRKECDCGACIGCLEDSVKEELKDGEIRQEDMPATAKAGQKFKYEAGEFAPLEGWGYCEECDGSTQHEDGFCLRESCKKEGELASTSSKMEHVGERICCVCKKEAEIGELKAYRLCVDCWRTGMINVPRETITGGF